MKINIHSLSGDVIEKVDADDKLFKVELKSSVIRQAVLSERTNLRQGTHSSKNRAAVNGGGKKPWKQKGRGVARAGTIRSPLWRGGGVVFGPEPHKYRHKLPKKMSKLARRSVISDKISKNEFKVLDKIAIDSKKTSDFISFLKKLKLNDSRVTILVSSFQENLILSSRNLKNVYVENVKNVSVYDLLDSEIIVTDKQGLSDLVKVLA
ncbi:MAG: 50S ribosomal protein L4 [Candidatus Marinimicrobia bacterium]|nr:50S ribosomal protein L4 [Candidatus Neomarinimicrobiota bacterium]|tara:strand:- start:13955 stop:14578 length:624 start_codon:yes stop_codon:yes gene_type:complete